MTREWAKCRDEPLGQREIRLYEEGPGRVEPPPASETATLLPEIKLLHLEEPYTRSIHLVRYLASLIP